MLELRILGPLEVTLDGQAVELGGPRRRALLVALLVRAGEPVSRDALIAVLWGEEASPTAAKALQVEVSRLRTGLGAAASRLETVGAGYRLVVEPGELDADSFADGYERGRALLAAGRPAEAARALREALALWRGPALADLRYERATQTEIRRLEDLRALALEERIEADLALGEHARLVGELEALVAEYPLRERLRGQQMLALYRAGRHADALAVFRHARDVLDTELGLEPGPDLRRLEQAILLHDPSLAAPPGPGATAAIPPAPPTPTFGREEDVRGILALLAGTRLLTLTGPGGVGKTRLAVEVARAAGGRFVSLASTADAERVAAAMCDALDVPRVPGETEADALERALAREPMLLVVDNLEHLPDAVPFIAQLLERAPDLTILATSRQPLALRAERVWPVAPLALLDDPERSPAVALFADRARAHDPSFALTADNIDAIAEVCERVGGLPLAIELAAGRLAVLGPAGLADRLADALAVLDHGPQDAPARHRTLRATLDWSYDLLDEVERDAFTALGVFAGGCELHVAEAVTAQPLPVLEGLVAKSLVIVRSGRLGLLEPVRQYAAERLGARPDADDVRARHFAQVLAMAESTDGCMWARGRSCPEFAALHRERDNLRAAIAWALTEGEPLDALRLAGALGTYGWLSHAQEDVSRWCADALAAAGPDAPVLARARAQLALAHGSTDIPLRIAQGEAALALFREAGDDIGVARSLIMLSDSHSFVGEYAIGLELAEEALAGARRIGDAAVIGMALGEIALGTPLVADALGPAREAAVHLRAADAPERLAGLLSTIGMAVLREDAYEHAEQLQREALDAALLVNDAHTLGFVHGNIGLAALLAGREAVARTAFREELAIARDHGFTTFHFEGLLGHAALAAAAGDDHLAAALYGAAWQHAHAPPAAAELPVYDKVEQRFIAAARERLGADAWDAATQAGRAMTADAALALALEPHAAVSPAS